MKNWLDHIQGVGPIMRFSVVVGEFAFDGLDPDMHPSFDEIEYYEDFIYRAVIAGELPYFKDGEVITGGEIPATDELLLRRKDLRLWLCEQYPDNKPNFLFSPSERTAVDALTEVAILNEQLADLKAQLADRDERLNMATDYWNEHQALTSVLKQEQESQKTLNSSPKDRVIKSKNNMIAALLELHLEPSSQNSIPAFKSQNEIISAILNNYSDTRAAGLSQRNMLEHFREAKEQLKQEILT